MFIKGHVLLYRLSRGKLGTTMRGQPVILVTTQGRKSGAARTVPLVPLREGAQLHVVASMAGAPNNPGWYHNLKANPEIEVQVGRERWHARAAVLPDVERSQVWSRVAAAMPNFAEYQQKTTRVIPVVRLSRKP